MKNGEMEMKRILYKNIEKYSWIFKIYILLFNKIKCNIKSLEINTVLFRRNSLLFNGNSNKFISGKNCSIQKNFIDIQGEGNEIYFREGTIIEENCSIRINGNNNKIIIEKGCKFRESSIFICGDNNLVHIQENCSGIFVELHMEQDNNRILIGKKTTLHGRQFRTIHFDLDEGTTLRIGEDCMFSNDIQLRTTDSHSIISLNGKRINYAKDIEIGRHCWIGMGVIILKGVKIEDNTVVAAGSVCTKKSKEQNIILAGNSAEIVKKNINWDRKFL